MAIELPKPIAVTPVPNVRYREFTKCGQKPLSGGQIWTYEANSTTPKITYQDPYGFSPNTNPIILDAAGEADIYLNGTYRFVVKDKNGVIQKDVAKIGSWYSGDLEDQFKSLNDALESSAQQLMQPLQEAIDTALAAGAGAAGWNDKLVQTWSGKTQEEKNKEFVSLHDYCKCDGTDESQKFKAAIIASTIQGRKLIAFGGSIQLSENISLRKVNFDLSSLRIEMLNDSMLIVGWSGGDALSKKQELGVVKKPGSFQIYPENLTKPTVRMLGSKCLNFQFGEIDYLQLYADTNPDTFPNDGSIAYCHITGELASRIHLTTNPEYSSGLQEDGAGSVNQWINSNYFRIARTMAIDIDGSYPHNGNIFFDLTMETSRARLNIERGNKNRFVNMRLEGSPKITFSKNTMGNIVERVWFGSQGVYLKYDNVKDDGLLNKITSVQEEMSHKIDIIKMNSQLNTLHNGYTSNYGYLSPSRRFLKTSSSSRILNETQPFLIYPSDILDFYCNNQTTLNSSNYTARIYFYNENMELCKNIERSWFTTGNFNTVNNESGYIEGGFNSLDHAYLALEEQGRAVVKYMSVLILCSSNVALSVSSQISVTLNTMRNITKLNETQSEKSNQFYYVVTKPTAFIGKVGDVVQGLDTSYRCRLMLETKLTIEAVPAASAITVSSLAGAGGIGAALSGDLIGIDLDDNSTHWTTISSLSGLNATLATALPTNASLGNNVYISRIV